MKTYFTLSNFLELYGTQEKCLQAICKRKYPRGVNCKQCRKKRKYYKVKNRLCYACSSCGSHLYPLKGTIFEKSRTPLPSWFYAMFLMINTRAGISAKHLQREIGVTYKTAWRMFQQIRILMKDADPSMLTGIVEVDETYVGGKNKNRRYRWFHAVENKEVLMGMVERKGRVRMRHIETSGKWALLEQIQANIDKDARIMTDEWRGYNHLYKFSYKHQFINHSRNQYKFNDIHTQNIENVWSHFKRGIYGVYRKVSKKHLQKYADEFAFRYNNRHNPSGMFDVLLSKIS